MELNDKQRMHVRNVRRAKDAYESAKRDAYERAKAAAAEEVAEYLRRVDEEVKHAHDAGVPKNQIGRAGLGTSNMNTVNAHLARAEEREEVAAVVAADENAAPGRFTLIEGGVRVILSGADLDSACDSVDFDTAVHAAPTSADFTVTEGGVLIPSTPGYLAELGERHPVVAWITDSAEHEAEALTWYRENKEN